MKNNSLKSTKPNQLAKVPSPFAPARAHAQRAFEHGMALANEAVMCGIELIRLREDHGEHRGGDRKSKNQKPHDVVFDSGDWPTLVQREVGISDETARRWMQAARAQLPALAGEMGILLCDSDAEIIDAIFVEVQPAQLAEAVAKLSNGKTLEQLLLPLDGNGAFDPTKLVGKARDAWGKIVALCDPYDDDHYGPKLFEPEEYEAMHEDALVMRKRVEAGEIPPTRAWAGLMGRAAADGKGGRNSVDHYRNLNTGLTKLGTSFAHWNDLGGEQRMQVEENWQKLWKDVPASIKADVKKLEGWK
jgi:hypothetical protein